MVDISSDLENITITCDSYVLLKDAEETYNNICTAFEKMTFNIDKWYIDEHVMDIICYHLSQRTNLPINLESDKGLYLFGIPVEIIKR